MNLNNPQDSATLSEAEETQLPESREFHTDAEAVQPALENAESTETQESAVETEIESELEVEPESEVQDEIEPESEEPIDESAKLDPNDEVEQEEPIDGEILEEEVPEVVRLSEEELAELAAARDRFLEREAKIEEHLDSLNAWIEEREQSYTWNLSEKLKSERQAVETDLGRAVQLLDSLKIPTPEELKFVSDNALHRLKMATLIWLAASMGLWLLKEIAIRAAQKLLGDNEVINLIITTLADWLSGDFMLYALIFFFVSFLLAFIGSFVAHYRDWSNVARALDRAQSAFDYASRLESHTHSEGQRLANLHRHTMRVLRVLAKVLRNPYKLPEGVDIDPSVDIDDKTLPLSVRFGVAKTGSRAQHLRLRRQVMRRMVRKSWRSNSYLMFVNKIGEEMGYDQEEFNVETMDRALSGDSDGLIAPFEMSLSDHAALEGVGMDQFETLSDHVREEIVPKIGLPIGLLHEKPLMQVFPEEAENKIAIEEFLSEAFNDEPVERTPSVSLQSLNRVAASKATLPLSRDNTITVALVPEDFKLEESGSEKQFIRDNLASTGAGGVDLTVRADIAGPVDKMNFTVFSASGLREDTPVAIPQDLGDDEGEM